MVRMITLMLIVPMIARHIPPLGTGVKNLSVTRKTERKDWVIMTPISIAAGLLGGFFQIPAGKMVGAMAASAIYSRKNNISPKVNGTLHSFLQCIVGGTIGLRVTSESVAYMKRLVIPLIVLNVLVLVECIVHAWLMCRTAKWDKLTSLLACVPGGLGPCVLLSVEMGADHSVVTVYQLARYLSVILFALVLGLFMRV
jgi:membrane AbrB-like protein